MTFSDWLHKTRATLIRERDEAWDGIRTSQHTIARLRADLEAARGECERLREDLAFALLTSTCSDPAAHVRLAAQLARRDSELQEARGEDPHRASLGEAS